MKELALKAFSATGGLPFNPEKIDLSQFPSSLANNTPIPEAPVQATCSTCRVNNVQLHPLVKQGCVPKRLAVFVYTAPSGKTKSTVKTVEKARIITSEEVRREVIEAQKRKREGKEDKKTGGKKKSTSKSKSASMVASKKALKKVSKKAAKSAFKKMIQGQSDDEDSDSEPEFYHTKRRRTFI